MKPAGLSITAFEGFPLVNPGDDLPTIVAKVLHDNDFVLADGDILVVAQKVVSKAEGRYVRLDDVDPSADARELAALTGKDARFVDVVLSQSASVVRYAPNVLIVEHRLGFIMANAGIDQSNIDHEGGERVLLLPADPDGFCARLRARLQQTYRVNIGVVMSDSFGRPWRLGTTGVAIGAAGIPALRSMIGQGDLFGRPMRMTEVAFADEIAAAAALVIGETAEGRPLAAVRGLSWEASGDGAWRLLRPRAQDLFR